MQAYHDEEWGVPERDPRALWEKLQLDGFQAGLAWITVLRKRDAFRKGFKGFDPKKVAKFGEKDVERLLGDAGIIRSRAKIEATIGNAQHLPGDAARRARTSPTSAGPSSTASRCAATGSRSRPRRRSRKPSPRS